MNDVKVKSIVIDASVARSAGETSEFPVSKNSREFLDSFLSTENKMVMTKEIKDEWDKHQSKYALRIRTSLTSKGRIDYIKGSLNNHLRTEIENCSIDSSRIPPMLKDVHLVEAALLSNRIVISNDNKVRNHFRAVCGLVPYLEIIVWVNPTKEEEIAIGWLISGAKEEEQRTLGYVSSVESTEQPTA